MSEDPDKLKSPAGNPPETPAPVADDSSAEALAGALKSSFFIVQIIMVVLFFLFLGSGCFVVKEQERAIVLRFGKPVGTGATVLRAPGFHFAFPKPIDEVIRIPYSAIQTADSSVGWYQTPAERNKGVPPPSPYQEQTLDPTTVSYVLTADTNILHVAGVLRYRITDPVKYYFGFSNTAAFVTNDLDNALLFAASKFTVDDALTGARREFKEAVENHVRDLSEKHGLGITVDGVDNFQVVPPLWLSNDFVGVTEANSRRESTILQARSYSSNIVGRALAEKETRTNVADAARVGMLQQLGAEVTNLNRWLPDYTRNPALVENLLITETFKRVWAQAMMTTVIPDLKGNQQIRIHLGPKLAPLVTLATNQAPPPGGGPPPPQ